MNAQFIRKIPKPIRLCLLILVAPWVVTHPRPTLFDLLKIPISALDVATYIIN